MQPYSLFALLLSRVLSILQASRLRHEYYTLQDEHEIMWTALSDIKRMSKEPNIQSYITKVQELINDKHSGKRKVYRIEG